MTNFYVTYTMPDKASRDGYLKEIKDNKIDEISKAEDGCYKYDYFYPVENDNTLFLWEQWESVEHQKLTARHRISHSLASSKKNTA